jgi:hypothetical protein
MLAPLHWVNLPEPPSAVDWQIARQRVQEWSDRKKNLFQPRHLEIA